MSRLKASSIALDIGVRFIKLVELKKEKDNIILAKVGMKEIPKGLNLDRDKVTMQLISQLLTENNIRPRPVSISVNGQSVFVRFVKLLQEVREDKLKQTMKFEAQNQIPFSMNEVLWDWSLLDKGKEGSPKKAVIVAIKKNLVEEMALKLSPIKLSAELIDVAPISVYNCMLFNEDFGPEGLGAILDIGYKATNFIIFNKGNVWIRSFPIAGERIEEASAQGLDELISEVERSLEYYFMQAGEDAPKERKMSQLFLTGGSITEEMESALSSKFNVKPQVMDPFRKLRVSKHAFQKLQAVGSKAHFSTVVGTALNGMVDLGIGVNFLKDALFEKKASLQKRLYAGFSMATGVSILICLSVFMQQDYYLKKVKLEKVEGMIETYRTYEPKIKKVREDEDILRWKIDNLYQLASSRAVWLGIFKDISGMLPEDLLITDISGIISIEKSGLGRMDMNGRALSYQSVNNFVSSLKALPGFSDVRPVSSSVEKDKDTGEEIVKFSITMDVVLTGS